MIALRDYNAAVDFVDRNVAEGRGDKTAFIDNARNLTYAELRDATARIGPMLARMGIEPENRIVLVLLDTVDFPVLFWGAIRAGVVPVLANTRLTVDQYRYLFEDSRAKAEDICIEQTVEFPAECVGEGTIRDHVFGRIESFERSDDASFHAVISYAVEIAAGELTQLLNVIFGNTSIKSGIRVEHLDHISSFIVKCKSIYMEMLKDRSF